MKYARTYCELKASLIASIAVQKTIKGSLKAYTQSESKDTALIENLSEKLRTQNKIVENEKKQLSTLESELKKLSAELDDVELKVFTLHHIKGYTLKKIAKKLYFSYDRVKQINKQIKVKIE